MSRPIFSSGTLDMIAWLPILLAIVLFPLLYFGCEAEQCLAVLVIGHYSWILISVALFVLLVVFYIFCNRKNRFARIFFYLVLAIHLIVIYYLAQYTVMAGIKAVEKWGRVEAEIAAKQAVEKVLIEVTAVEPRNMVFNSPGLPDSWYVRMNLTIPKDASYNFTTSFESSGYANFPLKGWFTKIEDKNGKSQRDGSGNLSAGQYTMHATLLPNMIGTRGKRNASPFCLLYPAWRTRYRMIYDIPAGSAGQVIEGMLRVNVIAHARAPAPRAETNKQLPLAIPMPEHANWFASFNSLVDQMRICNN